MYLIRIKSTDKILANTNALTNCFVQFSFIKHFKDVVVCGHHNHALQTIKTLSNNLLKKYNISKTDLEIIEIELKIK